jgi:hypothetical protein
MNCSEDNIYFIVNDYGKNGTIEIHSFGNTYWVKCDFWKDGFVLIKTKEVEQTARMLYWGEEKKDDFLIDTFLDCYDHYIDENELFFIDENEEILIKCKTKDENIDFKTSKWFREWVKGEF